MSEKAFCETCRNQTIYEIENEEITINLKSDSIVFDGIVARCTVCKEEIYVPAIEKINFKRFRVATKANNGEL